MTATVDPGAYADAVVRNDPAQRRQDYLRAIRFWARYPDPRIVGIVCCDNSGADTRDFHVADDATPDRPIEILSFSGNERPAGMHYGYAELGTLDYVLAHSTVLPRARHVVKITGRLIFPRLTSLLDRQDPNLMMAADCRRAYARESGPRLRVRTQLMIFETAFYRRELAGRRDEMIGRSTHIEEYLAEKAEAWRQRPGVTLRWAVECPPEGIGGDGRSFDSWRVRVRTAARAVLRRVLPSLWW